MDDVLGSLPRELKLKDKEVMRAIRDINNAPAKYDGTDRAEVPANKPLIAKVSGLSKDAVEYRLTQAGLGEDGMGLLTTFPPSVEGRQFGPKSAELTDKGIRVLSELDERDVEESGQLDEEAIKQLRARVESLESTEFAEDGEVSAGQVAGQLEQVQQRLDEMESMVEGNIQRVNERLDAFEARLDEFEELLEGEWGAVDDETADDIARTLNLSPVLFMLWSEMFGVDVRELVLQDEISDELKMETRQTLLESIQRGLDVDGDGVGEVSMPAGGSAESNIAGGGEESETEQVSVDDVDVSTPDT